MEYLFYNNSRNSWVPPSLSYFFFNESNYETLQLSVVFFANIDLRQTILIRLP